MSEGLPNQQESFTEKTMLGVVKEKIKYHFSVGHTDIALKIKDAFSLPEDVIQQAAKESLTDYLSRGNISTALEIKDAFSLPEGVIQSPEIQQAAKKSLTDHISRRKFVVALKIKDNFSLPEGVMMQAVKEGIIYWLSRGNIDIVLEIKDNFSISKEIIQQIAQENERLLLKCIDFFEKSVEPSDITQAYMQERERIVAGSDAEVGANFETLERVLGAERLKRLLLVTPNFWDNPHDNLLFMGAFQLRSGDEQVLLTRLVVQPLLVRGIDLVSFGQMLSSFDINIYINERGEAPFHALAEFERQVQMQKLNIRIPEGASEAFEEAVQTLILAPGVDVSFIRTLIDEYEQQNPPSQKSEVDGRREEDEYIEPYGEYEFDNRSGRTIQYARRSAGLASETPQNPDRQHNDNEYNYNDEDEGNNWNEVPRPEFASTLIDIIEGRDAIDERQVIRPWETEVSFDPLHKVLLAAAGIRGFNEQSPKLYGLLRNNDDLAFVVDALRARDKAKIEDLKTLRDELKAKYPDKDGRYDAEFRTNTEKETVFKLASGDEVTAIRIENRNAYVNSITPEEWGAFFAHITQAIRTDPSVATSVERLFATLAEDDRREMVSSFIDVEAGFFLESLEHIWGVYDDIVRERTEGDTPLDKDGRSAVVRETMRRVLSDETIDRQALAEFLLYMGLNNRSRVETSKKVLGAVLSLFGSKEGKKQYEEQARAAGESNLAQAYLKGKVKLGLQDEQLLRDAYSAAVKTGGTRSLGIEIAKKSDPRGWVCGDYTNCCMPLTSSKNQEYLLREDMSYFLVSRNDASGSSDLVGQSVLVYGEDEKQITVAIDNIEIANRAVDRGERAVIAKAYDELKRHIIDTYGDLGKQLKIVIGTSYNDDGGLVTGPCELKSVDAKPLGGDMRYSDWYHHSSNYVFYDSEAKESVQKYYGLSLDAWDTSRTRGYIARHFTDLEVRGERERRIEDLLHKIGRGEDDGDGDLSFADNYSVALVRADKQVGYVIAADYLSNDDADDLICLEEMHLDEALPDGEKQDIFERYLKDKKFRKNDDLDGLKVSKQFITGNPFALDVLKKTFANIKEEKTGEGVIIRF